MGDQWLNDCLVTCIENDLVDGINNEKTIHIFQNMKTVVEDSLHRLDYLVLLFLFDI